VKKPETIDINIQQKYTKIRRKIFIENQNKNNVDFSNKSNKEHKNTLNINIQKVKKINHLNSVVIA
jgi:hypothetical protein